MPDLATPKIISYLDLTSLSRLNRARNTPELREALNTLKHHTPYSWNPLTQHLTIIGALCCPSLIKKINHIISCYGCSTTTAEELAKLGLLGAAIQGYKNKLESNHGFGTRHVFFQKTPIQIDYEIRLQGRIATLERDLSKEKALLKVISNSKQKEAFVEYL